MNLKKTIWNFVRLSGGDRGDGKGLRRLWKEVTTFWFWIWCFPGRDGFSITQEVRSKKDIPILLVSARRDDIDKIRGLGAGRTIIWPSPSPPVSWWPSEPIWQDIQDFRIAVRKNEIVKSGLKDWYHRQKSLCKRRKRCPLHPEEFDLLAFRTAHPNRVYTKEELFRRFGKWSPSAILPPLPCISKKLREKIEMEEAGEATIYQTIWGVGIL